MRRRPARAATVAAALALAGCFSSPTPAPRPACPTSAPTVTGAGAVIGDSDQAVVDTVTGSFTIDLLPDVAPIATANFVALARCGFYDGISFHRVLAGFVIQAGDPHTRTNHGDFEGLGTGGPGYGFEIEEPPRDLAYDPYVVAMANDGVANGSQFFVTLADLDAALRASGIYTIFGRVVEGTGVIDRIAAVPVGDPQFGVPLEPVIIESITIRAAPAASPTP